MGVLQEWIDELPFVPQAIGIGITYGGYFATSLAALICMTAISDQQWPIDFAVYTIFVTSGLHFGLTASGFAFLEQYDHLPVQPTWAFLFADYLMAGALGAAISAYTIEPSNRVAAYVATSVTMATQMLCFYKTYSLVSYVKAGRRNALTGRRYTVP